MVPERARTLSRLFLLAAAAVALLAAVHALTIVPPPNLDRYDYLGRAYHATQGEGLRPLIVYPLRMVFPGADHWPPENLSRPPLWPLLLVPGVLAGLGPVSGVWLSLLLLAALLALMKVTGDRTFGGGAGGMAALALASSFTTWRVLVVAGPEIALALLTLILWSWRPRGGGIIAHLACGSLYGILPLLHPTGWLLAGAAFLARSDRYERRHLPWLALGALGIALPWHLHLWLVTGNPLGTLQSYAELARNLDHPGGLGTYRGLTPEPTLTVLSQRGAEVLALGLHRLKMHLLHLDAWIAWPLVALAALGAAGELRLALRDAALVGAVAIILAPFSAEFRPLLPLLPVLCLWAGAGIARLTDWLSSSAIVAAVGLAAAVAAWFLPLGASSSPLGEAEAWPLSFRRPPATVVHQLQRAGKPLAAVFTESAVLAWESRREVVFLPENPQILQRLRSMPALKQATILALGQGRHSQWVQGAGWDSLLARCTVIEEHPDGPLLLELPPLEEAAAETLHTDENLAPTESTGKPVAAGGARNLPWTIQVDPRHRLPQNYIPDDLVKIPVPPASREGLRLRERAARALIQLVTAAHGDHVDLRVVSAFRSWTRQRTLYDSARVRHGEDQRWVAPPGASEHQLGTTVDFADAGLRHAVDPSFATTAEGRWLASHAKDWDFHLSYPPDSLDRGEYHPEPWHYRYLPDKLPLPPAQRP